MPIPALIEHNGCIHFSLVGNDGFNLICPVASNKVRPINATPNKPSDDYVLLACGKVVEATLRASGQWQSVLEFMATQMQHAVMTRASKRAQGTDKRYLKQQAKFDLQARLMGLMPW